MLIVPLTTLAQNDTITLNKNKVTQIIMHDRIRTIKGGFVYTDIVSDIDGNVLYLQPTDTVSETNINIITEDDCYFNFTLKYSSNADRFNYIYDQSDAIFVSSANKIIPNNHTHIVTPTVIPTTTTSQVTEVKVIDNNITDTLLSEEYIPSLPVFRRTSQNIMSQTGYLSAYNSIRLKNLIISIKGIYIRDNKMFFRLEIDNSSNIVYDLEQIIFYVTAIKKKKAVTNEQLEYRPIYIYNNVDKVEPKQHIETIYCFEKFTISPEKQLMIDIIERNGERNMRLPIQTNMIMAAQSI